MAVVNGYCTVPQLRGHLKDEGARLDDALLERAINAASRAVDRHCGRRFWRDASAVTKSYVPTHSSILFVDDISTRTGLVVSVGSDGSTFPTPLTSTEFVLEPRNADVFAGGDTADAYAFWQIKRLTGAWTVNDLPTVQVTARFGWSAIPPEVEEATILRAASLFKRKDAPFGVAGFNDFGAVRITRADPDVMDLLSTYQLAGFA